MKKEDLFDFQKFMNLHSPYCAAQKIVRSLVEKLSHKELLEYGSKDAEIIEYYITDSNGLKTNALIKGSRFTIHMKVRFNKDVEKS